MSSFLHTVTAAFLFAGFVLAGIAYAETGIAPPSAIPATSSGGAAQSQSAAPVLGAPSQIPSNSVNMQTLPSANMVPGTPVAVPALPPASPAKEPLVPATAGADLLEPGLAPEKAPQEVLPSRMESAINEADKTLDKVVPMEPVPRDLRQFGYHFFEAVPGFAPVMDTPVGPDYVIGPGDTIILTSWGTLEGNFRLDVNRSGEVMLPKVGTVRVWGIPLAQLPGLFKEKLAKIFKNVQINVTMGKLRLVRVYVVGEVKAPGGYDIGALSTLVNVLSAAGGPTKDGSLRRIQVKRNGQTVETVDLYDFFLRGDKSRDIRVQSGDTIYVPTLGRVAGIDGNVRRPAIYELNEEKTLKDLVALAEGILPTGHLQRVQISRVSAHEKKQAADLSLDPKATPQQIERLLASVVLQDMDTVTVFPIDNLLRGHVRLAGYLLRPGDYAISDGMRVSDLLPIDVLLPEYYTQVFEITRFNSQDLRPEKLYPDLGKALSGDPEHNLQLREFDVIRLFSRWEMEEMPKAKISGEVLKPGEYRVFDNTTLRDLVFAAGNLKKTAFLKNAEVARSVISPEGVNSHLIQVDLDAALKGDPTQNVLIKDMDEVVVRRIPNWQEETERYATLRGEVRFPGVYPILKGERLSALLLRAGGFTDKAYFKGAKFTRKAVALVQQKRMDEVILRTEQDIAQKQQELASVASSKEELEATQTALEGLRRNLDKVKLAKAEGRVSITLAQIGSFQGTPSDVELMGGDTLEIPQSSEAVMIMGDVYNPTTLIHSLGKPLSYYLGSAGGPTENAEAEAIYLIRADGTVQSRRQASSFLFYDSFMSQKLDAGDSIVVPQKLEKVAWMRDIKDIATILGQIALAAGVVFAAGL